MRGLKNGNVSSSLRLVRLRGDSDYGGRAPGIQRLAAARGSLEFSGLIVAAILTSVLAVQRPVAEDRGMMPLAFVIHFASLLLFGPLVTMIVVTAGTAAYMLGDPQWTRPR